MNVQTKLKSDIPARSMRLSFPDSSAKGLPSLLFVTVIVRIEWLRLDTSLRPVNPVRRNAHPSPNVVSKSSMLFTSTCIQNKTHQIETNSFHLRHQNAMHQENVSPNSCLWIDFWLRNLPVLDHAAGYDHGHLRAPGAPCPSSSGDRSNDPCRLRRRICLFGSLWCLPSPGCSPSPRSSNPVDRRNPKHHS